MRILIQRVSSASVLVQGAVTGSIDEGLLLLIGVTHADTDAVEDRMADKVIKLRIFSDEKGLMNRSVIDVAGGILAVSQFTLYADAKNGNRPSYINAARPEQAAPAFDRMVAKFAARLGRPVATGVFGADMRVALVNDGPVTLWLDSETL
jgi:D-aminoacyl-tRNA deacylase